MVGVRWPHLIINQFIDDHKNVFVEIQDKKLAFCHKSKYGNTILLKPLNNLVHKMKIS